MKPPIHGLLAEFDTPGRPDASRRSRPTRATRRMERTSRFRSRGWRTRSVFRDARAARDVARRHRSAASGGYFMQYYSAVIGYPINVRRPAVPQLAGVHSDDVRADDSGRALSAVFGMLGPQRPADAVSSRCSTCRVLRWRAAIDFFCASRRPIRVSIGRRRTRFLNGCSRMTWRRWRIDGRCSRNPVEHGSDRASSGAPLDWCFTGLAAWPRNVPAANGAISRVYRTARRLRCRSFLTGQSAPAVARAAPWPGDQRPARGSR